MPGTKSSTGNSPQNSETFADHGASPLRPVKGRGAASNPAGRFETQSYDPFDDGWEGLTAYLEDRPKTSLVLDTSKTVIARNHSPDVPFDRSINPYRGCEHGCIYCFARPSHAYLGFGPGLDFETKILFKPDAPELLEKELRKPGYQCQTIAIGTNTDAYQPVERREQLMRAILKVLQRFHHPVSIVTKSALVMRDLDILADMAKKGLATVSVSVTTLDAAVSRALEPRAAAPARRLETLAALSEAKIPGAVMAAPMIPVINDWELERILEAAVRQGTTSAGYIFLRLPFEVKDLFKQWLEVHVPQKAAHVMSLIRQSRGGKENQAQFGQRMRGSGPYADLLSKRFAVACKRLGLNKNNWHLDTTQFQPPPRAGDQMLLF